MNEQHSDLLDRARGLASAKALIERAIKELIDQAIVSEIDVSALARSLRVHRSTIYRSNTDARATRGTSASVTYCEP